LDKRPVTEQLEFWKAEDTWLYAGHKGIKIPVKLSSLRQKLYRKAKEEPKFRFYVLYDRIFRKDVIACAYAIAKAKDGAPGIDGVTFKQIDASPEGSDGFVDSLREALKTKTYKPDAVRRVYIPKPDGRQRPLGIPTIRDRVVQLAALLVLEPIFEADFLDCSYGFRPGKSAHGALKEIHKNLKQGRRAVYDADLSGYFDSIPHDKLMKCLQMRITDRSVLKLIRMWLNAPVVEPDGKGGSKVTRNKTGTPQGGVISPLLANIYLHWFDKVFNSQSGPRNWANARIIRYADDFVVMARYQSKQLQDYIRLKIESWLGLKLNMTKTKRVNLNKAGQSFDFLGYTFKYSRDLKGRGHSYLNPGPSKKTIKAEKENIRGIINRKFTFMALPKLIERVNRHLVGWSGYFRLGYPRSAYREINWYVCDRLIRHLHRRSQRPYRPPKGQSYYRHFRKTGLIYLR
jgi:RNA-directed DNA polymerase